MKKRTIDEWKMDYRNYTGIACTAPCSMYSVLLENGYIDDPFYRMNEKEATKLSDFPCDFSAVFSISEEEYGCEFAEITFGGLDTICSIYLNGKLLDRVHDMHIAYEYDIKKLLCVGENTLKLHFESPTEYFKKMNNRHFLWTNTDTIEGAAHLRKSLSMSGWDWAPALPDMGIFRPVELKFYDSAKITEFFVYQKHCKDKVILEVTAETNGNADVYFCIDGKRIKLENGRGTVDIDAPRLWWPNGYGEQNLYDVTFEAVSDGRIVDRVSKKIGMRTLELCTEKDSDGREFCFAVNGIKIFAMGANYVQEDSLFSRIAPQKTKKLIDACIDANYNCIRIWGGGYYPDDYFYDMCDEAGLVVWQDFGIACCNVWLHKEFREDITREATENVKRLRHHASLGLFCGNNEMEWMLDNPELCDELVKFDYLQLYEHILPDICQEYAPQTSYWPSSPSCGGALKSRTNRGREMCIIGTYGTAVHLLPITENTNSDFARNLALKAFLRAKP